MVSSRDLLDRFLLVTSIFGESKTHFESPGKKMLSQILTCWVKTPEKIQSLSACSYFLTNQLLQSDLFIPQNEGHLSPVNEHIFPKNQVTTWRSWNLEGLAFFFFKTILFFQGWARVFSHDYTPEHERMSPKKGLSQLEIHCPTIDFQGTCSFSGE